MHALPGIVVVTGDRPEGLSSAASVQNRLLPMTQNVWGDMPLRLRAVLGCREEHCRPRRSAGYRKERRGHAVRGDGDRENQVRRVKEKDRGLAYYSRIEAPLLRCAVCISTSWSTILEKS